MDHVITIGDVVRYTLIAGGVLAVLGVVGYIVLVILNPFSSGH